MTWARFDDQFHDDPDCDFLSTDAICLHVFATTWCCRNLTDGKLPKGRVALLKGGRSSKALKELLSPHNDNLPWWTDKGDHYMIRSFLKYNKSKKQVLSERTVTTKRVEKWRNGKPGNTVGNGVTNDTSNDIGNALVTAAPVPDPVPSPKGDIPPVAPQGPIAAFPGKLIFQKAYEKKYGHPLDLHTDDRIIARQWYEQYGETVYEAAVINFLADDYWAKSRHSPEHFFRKSIARYLPQAVSAQAQSVSGPDTFRRHVDLDPLPDGTPVRRNSLSREDEFFVDGEWTERDPRWSKSLPPRPDFLQGLKGAALTNG